MSHRILITVLCTVLVFSLAHCKDRNGRDRNKKKKLDQDVAADDLASLAERLNDLESRASCPENNVVFHFHGDDHSHDEDDDADHHIHVHVHTDRHHDHDSDAEPHDHKAICDIHDPEGSKLNGQVLFTQSSVAQHADVEFKFEQFGPDDAGDVEYSAHVHVFGDITEGCVSLGPHYNPYDDNVDVGVLGSISTTDGQINTAPTTTHLTLYGHYSIIGRSVVVHAPDSTAIGCCVIGWSKSDYTDDHAHSHDRGHSHDHHSHGEADAHSHHDHHHH